jgi:putative ABC transport system permease protein
MKIFITNFRKQKLTGLLNICTLSLGIMVAVIVGLWVIHELSFDQFHKDGDRIHRIITQIPMNGASARMAATYSIYGSQVKEKLPSVEDVCRLVKDDEGSIQINNVLLPHTFVYLVDQNFFSFFTFPLKEGTPDIALSSPDRVVISESAASRYFPQQNAVGQIIKYGNSDFTVSGIMKDMPKNSSLQTDFVFPFLGKWLNNGWGGTMYHHTFLLLQKGLPAGEMNAPVAQILYDAGAEGGQNLKEMGIEISLEALGNMHFDTDLMYDFTGIKGSKALIMVFALIALMMLIISCINFANLFVSTSFIRAKTIGIKKCAGAGKMTLVREFYLETACYVLVSAVLGLFLAIFTMPAFNNFTQSDLAVDFTSPLLYGFLAVLFTVTVLLAGSYPALYMTRFNVIETLSGKFKGRQASVFQKSLMVVQFVATIALMTVTVFMQKQVDFIISYDLGFDKEHILYVESRSGFDRNFDALAGEFLKEPSITGVARKNVLPTETSGLRYVGKIPLEGQQAVMMELCFVSPNYFDVLGMKFTDGENPFLHVSSGNNAVLNESAVRILGLSHVGEKLISLGSDTYTVKGVIKDAYTKSLHQEVAPQVYRKMSDSSTGRNMVFFKIEGDPQKAIGFIEQKWKERVDDFPFEYSFLDDTYKQLYKAETSAGRVYAFAMLIALIITVSGLFAMVYFVTRRRLREIAIRKVHGASLKDIFLLLNKGLLLLAGIAFMIACPIAYYGLQKWLSGFTVRTSLSIWVFLLVGAVALLITLLTTGYQTWKAATENPANALKNE